MEKILFLLSAFFFFITTSFAQRPIFPNSIVLPVHKDVSTLQYVTKISMGEAMVSADLVVDIGGQFMWVGGGFTSQNPILCSSLQCSMAKADGCGTEDLERKICRVETGNGVTKVGEFGNLVEDNVGVKFRDGSSSGATVRIYDFLFSCTQNVLLGGLAKGVKGMLGLGNSRIALHSQLSSRFGFQRRFGLCLSSSNGVVLAGDGPYVSSSRRDVSRSLVYTPLVGVESAEYFINVKSIKINGVKLHLNSSKMVLDKEGNGGTKISTILPYATLRSSVYDEFVKVYVEVAGNMNMARVDSVAPFDVCFSTTGENQTTWVGGTNVPAIDFGLQSEMVKWRINGRNSLVRVSDNVMCLGFLNGGRHQKASIVIGGHQLEENLLEFNLGTSMLGFVSFGNEQLGSCSDFSLHNPMAG